ncbi:MAG: polysaccharide biosynthesis/export family protein [Aeoliella sp.]
MINIQRITVLLLMAIAGATGCVSSGKRGLPVGQVQPHWLASPKVCKRPIDFTLLRKDPAVEHLVGARDVLGVYVEGVFSGEEISSGGSELPEVSYYFQEDPAGTAVWPAVGQPLTVQADGTVRLPLVSPVQVQGLTLQQAADQIQAAYIAGGFLKEDPSKSFVQVSLVRPRVHRVMVVREDNAAITPSLIQRTQYVMANRGDAQVVQLPQQESDLLHALVATGGLPGEDANNEVWILRGTTWQDATHQFDQGMAPCDIACQGNHVIIPLRYECGAPLPFGREDIVLRDGDVVFVEKRIEKHFYTGGLLNAGQIPLPRDEDIDILEAIALANVGIAGMSGQIAIGQQGQFSSGPGNVCPPTRAQVIRKVSGCQQVVIDVDLRKAIENSEERILIQPEDFVMLHYRPTELLTNIALNFVDFNYVIPN